VGSPKRTPGLRERKKIRTREAIRRAATQLVESNGYANTTVEQIADAADVSPATFFRYFPSKDSSLLANDVDQVAIAALAQQPPDVPTAQAFRRALEITQTTLAEDEWEAEHHRRQVVFSNPELRELQYAEHRRTAASMTDVECQRLGRDPDDFEVHVFFSAIFGALLTIMDKGRSMSDGLFQALDFVEAGMHLQRRHRRDDFEGNTDTIAAAAI
jgi:AcrR family transcriptional regulator